MKKYMFAERNKAFSDIEECYKHAVADDLNNFIRNIYLIIALYPLLLPLEVGLNFQVKEDERHWLVPHLFEKINVKIIDTMPDQNKIVVDTVLKYMRANWDFIQTKLRTNDINMLLEISAHN